MKELEEKPVVDAIFPSGPWVGYYVYPGSPERHRMDLELTFRGSLVDGQGTDDIARFFIRGRYDGGRLEVWWVKQYPGSHDVYYRGFREGRGIWGVWEIGETSRGGFMIWPRGAGEAGQARAEERAEVPGHAA